MGRKVLLVHWGQTGGGGPRFTYELARCWEERYPGEASTSFNVNAESAADYRALDIPRLEVRTYRRTKSGVLLGLYRLPIIAWRLRRFLRKHDVGAVVCVMTSVYQWMIVPRILPPSARYIVCVHDALPHPGEERPARDWRSGRSWTGQTSRSYFRNPSPRNLKRKLTRAKRRS